ncbi:MAG: GMC family oxidoreductase N-terminal domain-containing protein [Rhodospirillaceae bacterium]|nr:GMC family oxidoreductase N-terminal domain-containing protein [Rhodospirillaceae bacterium]
MSEFTHIIVGGGSAGSALAFRLATNHPAEKILLLEAGGRDWSPFIHVPAAIVKAMGNPSLDWMHMAEPDASRDGKVDLWPAGKVLGGSSSINGMLYVRGQARDYNKWAENGCTGWSYNDLLPIFQRLERTAIGDASVRGRTGPVHVDRLRTTHPLAHVFVDAAKETGIRFNDDYNGASQLGVAYSQVTQSRGWRYHAARAYLWPGKKPSNLKIITSAMVTGLTFEGSRCTGVQYQKGNTPKAAKASSGVTLSAGTLSTPKILMLSGIGPEDELRSHGIEVRRNAPGVGQNLQEHPEGMVSIEVNQSTFNTEINSWKIAIHAVNWLLFGRGPATSPYPHAVAFTKSDASQDFADIQVQLGPYAFSFDENGVIPHDKPAISAAVNIAYPKTRGRVHLNSSDPFVAPKIAHNLFDDEDDLVKLMEGCKSVRRILSGPAFAPHRIAERLPGEDVQSDDEWADFLRKTAFLGYHVVGTCRMGSDEEAVVTPDLKVRGVDDLRVADASIMPELISGNTNATALMIGEKAADLITA